MRAPTAADDTATLVHYCARQDGKGGWPEWRNGAWYAPDDDEPIPDDALRAECLAIIADWAAEDAATY